MSGKPDFSLLDCTVSVTYASGSLILSSRVKKNIPLETEVNVQMEAYKVFGEF